MRRIHSKTRLCDGAFLPSDASRRDLALADRGKGIAGIRCEIAPGPVSEPDPPPGTGARASFAQNTSQDREQVPG